MAKARTRREKSKDRKRNYVSRKTNLGGSTPETVFKMPLEEPKVQLLGTTVFQNLITKREQGLSVETENVVTVFSGLSKVNGPSLLGDCSAIGAAIANARFTMVCAGASIGCQNSLVQSALTAEPKGKVIAVTIPKFAGEVTPGVRTIVVDSTDLSERKNVMKRNATFGFIILPGGPGTFDELWEVISERAEGLGEGSKKNIVVINTDGFFEPVRAQLKIMSKYFDWHKYEENVTFIDNISEIEQLLKNYLV